MDGRGRAESDLFLNPKQVAAALRLAGVADRPLASAGRPRPSPIYRRRLGLSGHYLAWITLGAAMACALSGASWLHLQKNPPDAGAGRPTTGWMRGGSAPMRSTRSIQRGGLESGQELHMRATIGSFAAAAAVIGTATASANAQQAVQWRVEDGGNGHWYAIGPNFAWQSMARAHAQQRGAHLLMLDDVGEQQFCLTLPSFTNDARAGWLGMRLESNGWRWDSGSAVTDTISWLPGNPCTPCDEPAALLFRDSIFGTGVGDTSDPHCCSPYPSTLMEWSADCNGDGIVDYGQILNGQLVDSNSNGVPDTCELGPCAGDVIPDGLINGVDLAAVLSAWGTTGQGQFSADANRDGIVDGIDLSYVLSGWGNCITVPTWATLLELEPDPAVVIDAALRSAITSTGLAWRVRDIGTGIEMVLIPPGTYSMGCSPSSGNACFANESPVHTVTLTSAFYLGRYEVTQAQWTGRMGSNPSLFQGSEYSDAPNRPVERVTWNMIQPFLSATGLRLPTEAEWEYSYRAGTMTAYHSLEGHPNGTNDDALLASIGWFEANSGNTTHPIGQKHPNGFGIYDMAGNVWEWVNDWYSATYYASSPAVNPAGPTTGSMRSSRGGSYASRSEACRSSNRHLYFPDGAFASDGFRVARNP
jgi:formylglycine-generating enzyme required for sulfatase activity